MRFVDALKWTLIHRGISLVSLLLGLALVGVGLMVGLGDAMSTLANDPTSPGDALAAGNPVVTIALVALGIAVWLLGKSYALYLTMPRATGQAAVDEFDMKQVRSEVLDALDERLSTIEDDLEATRRSVADLKRNDHAAAFDESDALDTSGMGDPSTSPGHTSTAADDGPTQTTGAGSTATATATSSDRTGGDSSVTTQSTDNDGGDADWQFGDDQEGQEREDAPVNGESDTSPGNDEQSDSTKDPLA